MKITVSLTLVFSLFIQKLGSDHLALVSEFAFAEDINEGNNYMSTISDGSIPASGEDSA